MAAVHAACEDVGRNGGLSVSAGCVYGLCGVQGLSGAHAGKWLVAGGEGGVFLRGTFKE